MGGSHLISKALRIINTHNSSKKPLAQRRFQWRHVIMCYDLSALREEKTRLFLNHAFPEWHPPCSSFSPVSGVWGAKTLLSVGRTQIRHFRRFRQNDPFLAGDKNTVYQKHGLCHPGICVGWQGKINKYNLFWLDTGPRDPGKCPCPRPNSLCLAPVAASCHPL